MFKIIGKSPKVVNLRNGNVAVELNTYGLSQTYSKINAKNELVEFQNKHDLTDKDDDKTNE